MTSANRGLGDVGSRRSIRAPRLLFVDDDRCLLESVRRLLGCLRPSWKVECATHAGEAMALLLCNEFDIVTMGLTAPGADAPSTLERVARRQPAAARVVFSSHVRASDPGVAWRWVQHVLRQPTTAGQLVQFLDSLLPEALREPADDAAAG